MSIIVLEEREYNPDELESQTVAHLQQATGLMKKLGDMAVVRVPEMLARETAQQQFVSQSEAEKLHEQELIEAFVNALPKASLTQDLLENSVVATNRFEFSGLTLEQARLLESLVWWIQTDTIYPMGVNERMPTWVQNRPPQPSMDHRSPAFLIGEKIEPATNNADANVSMLLVPAFKPLPGNQVPNLITVWTSLRLRDRADELGVSKLAEPVTERTLKAYRQGDHYGLAEDTGGVHHRLHFVRHLKLIREPGNEPKAIRFWKKMDHKIVNWHGLDAEMGREIDTPDSSTVAEFEVNYHAMRLAMLLGLEQEFNQTIQKLNSQ